MTARLKVALLGVVLAALAALLYQNLEWVEETGKSAISAEARRHSMLAAYRLIEQQQRQPRWIDSADFYRAPRLLAKPAEAPGTIIMQHIETALPSARWRAISRWIAAGGHLIAGVDRRQQLHGSAAAQAVADYGFTVRGSAADGVAVSQRSSVQFKLPNVEYPLRARLDNSSHLHSDIEALLRIDDRVGSVLLQLPVGAGKVTLLTDSRLWNNRRIGLLDHASLLIALLGDDPHHTVAISESAQQPTGLFTLIWQRARLAVLLGAMLIAAFLWRAAGRFGPLAAPPRSQSRDMREHFYASSRFHWRYGDRATVNAAARQAQLRSLNGHQLDANIDRATLTQLTRTTGLPTAELRAALLSTPTTARPFIRATRTLQLIDQRRRR